MASTALKKRKGPIALVDSQKPSKKIKRDGQHKESSRDREFHITTASLVISIPPIFANNPRAGAEDILDSMVMRYLPALQGVVLSYSDLTFIDATSRIIVDCPFLVCKIAFKAVVWSPRIGMKIFGKVNLCSPDHISLLVHRTFNASIPRHHIPSDDWEFEYGPAENDPEFGIVEQDSDAEAPDSRTRQEGGGKWVRTITNDKIGHPSGFVEFTVIGLTVANEMLSLLGSIQPDPFSPAHTIHARSPSPMGGTPLHVQEDELASDASNEDSDEDEEGDTFQKLGKLQDKAATAARDEERKAQASSVGRKKRKGEDVHSAKVKKN